MIDNYYLYYWSRGIHIYIYINDNINTIGADGVITKPLKAILLDEIFKYTDKNGTKSSPLLKLKFTGDSEIEIVLANGYFQEEFWYLKKIFSISVYVLL